MDWRNNQRQARPVSASLDGNQDLLLGQTRNKSQSVRTDRQQVSHIIMEDSPSESEGEISQSRNNESLKKSKTIKISLTKREREQLKKITYIGEDGEAHIDTNMLMHGLSSKELSQSEVLNVKRPRLSVGFDEELPHIPEQAESFKSASDTEILKPDQEINSGFVQNTDNEVEENALEQLIEQTAGKETPNGRISALTDVQNAMSSMTQENTAESFALNLGASRRRRQTGAEQAKTELNTRTFYNKFAVQLAFWMRGDFLVMVVFDKRTNQFHLDLYHYDQENMKQDTQFLFESKDFVKIRREFSQCRATAAIYIEEQNSITRKVTQRRLFVLSSKNFKNERDPMSGSDSGSEYKPYILANGLESINQDIFANHTEVSDAKSDVFLVFTPTSDMLNSSLRIYYQTKKESQTNRGSGQTQAQAYQDQHKIKVFEIKLHGKFNSEAAKLKQIRSLKNKDIEEIVHGKQRLEAQPIEMPFLPNRRLIGVFLFKRSSVLHVYSDGHLQRDDQVDPEKLKSLPMPFKEANKCYMTKINLEFPLLVMKSSKLSTIGFKYFQSNWIRKFIIDPFKWDVKAAYGPFLLGVSMDDKTMKILELGGPQDNSIVTEMSIGFPGVEQFFVDAYYEKPNFSIGYEKNRYNVHWEKYHQERQLFHTKNDVVTQICDSYMLEIRWQDTKIIFSDLSLIDEGTQYLFDVDLPKTSKHKDIRNFKPVINESGTLMALAVSYGLEEAWRDDKYQGIIIVDLVERKAYQSEEMEHNFRSLFFAQNKLLICQSMTSVFKIAVIEHSDQEKILEIGEETSLVSDLADSKELLDAQAIDSNKHGVRKLKRVLQLEIQDSFFQTNYDQKISFGVNEGKLYTLSVNTGQRVEIQTFNLNEENSQLKTELVLPNPQQSKYVACRRFSACLCKGEDFTKIVVMFSDFMLCWLYTINLNEQTNKLTLNDAPKVFPIKFAMLIEVINHEQILIQTLSGFVVVNMAEREIDLKFKFVQNNNFELTVGHGLVAVPRKRNGIIVDIGDCDSNEHLKTALSSKKKLRSFRNMNDIVYMNRKIYGSKLGYLLIDESVVNWSTRFKLLPIKLNFTDHIKTKRYKKRNSQTGKDEDVEVYNGYCETTFLCQTYNNNFTIWEAKLRDGILKGKVEINDFQLDRILSPVLGDNNDSLLHKMSQHTPKALYQLFTRTSIKDRFVNQQNKRFPFYFNFDKKSPLDIAIEAFDFESFNFLLYQMIHLQNGFESSHLVDSWLIHAIQLGLDIKRLFESKICTTSINRDSIHYIEQYPDFHSNQKSVTLRYDGSIETLIYDDKAYNSVFGHMFGNYDPFEQIKSNSLRQANTRAITEEQKEQLQQNPLNPIQYHVDYLLSNCSQHTITEFTRKISETNDMALFRSPFIQRWIDYQWNGAFKVFLYLNFVFHLISSALILVNLFYLHNPENENADTDARKTFRFWINVTNCVIILISVGSYEFAQIKHDRLDYFKSFANINDILFVVTFAGASISDYLVGTDIKVNETAEVTLICYSLLIITSAIKLLNVLRVFNNISFIVKMLVEVGKALIPFLLLFDGFILVFALIMQTLGAELGELEGKPYEGLNDYLGYNLFIFRTSLGDFEVEPFRNLPTASRIVLWCFWLLLVAANTIIFLNFLIAVISDCYEQVMETRTEEIFQKRALLIVESADVLQTNAAYRQLLYTFTDEPGILITRSGELKENHNDWSGFLKDIKLELIDQNKTLEAQINRMNENLTRQVQERQSEITGEVNALFAKVIEIEHILERDIKNSGAPIRSKTRNLDENSLEHMLTKTLHQTMNT